MRVQPLADVYYLCLMEHWGRDHHMSLGKLDKLDNFMQQIKQVFTYCMCHAFTLCRSDLYYICVQNLCI